MDTGGRGVPEPMTDTTGTGNGDVTAEAKGDLLEVEVVQRRRGQLLRQVWLSVFGATWTVVIGFLLAHAYGSQGLSPQPFYFQLALNVSVLVFMAQAGRTLRAIGKLPRGSE